MRRRGYTNRSPKLVLSYAQFRYLSDQSPGFVEIDPVWNEAEVCAAARGDPALIDDTRVMQIAPDEEWRRAWTE